MDSNNNNNQDQDQDQVQDGTRGDDSSVGFSRKEFRSSSLAGEANTPSMHFFVVYGKHTTWPARFDEGPFPTETDSNAATATATAQSFNPVHAMEKSLKRVKENSSEGTVLGTALGLGKDVMKDLESFRVTAAEANSTISSSNSSGDTEGDVLVFPDRVRVKGAACTVEQAECFGEKYLSGEFEHAGLCEPLKGPQVFVCAHQKRDRRCGYCGPVLVDCLQKEIQERGSEKTKAIQLRSCSHIGGHKFAGNVIVYRECDKQKSVGDWLSYVSPNEVKDLVDFAIESPAVGKDMIPSIQLWRGRDGISPEQHKSICRACFDVSGSQAQVVDDIEDYASPPPDSMDSTSSSSSFSSTSSFRDANPSSVTSVGERKVEGSSRDGRPKVIFVLGGPGAGKGTQCSLLEQRFDFLHLSAGELLREERKNPKSQYGNLIASYIADGKIVPVEITVGLLFNAMKASERSSFLIDGFPRNEDNWSGWQKVVGDAADVRGVLFFDCPEAVMEERLLGRGLSSGRTDDNIESIRKRFRTYKESTRPIIDLFASKGKMWRVVADRSVEEVYAEVESLIPSIVPGLQPRHLHGRLDGLSSSTNSHASSSVASRVLKNAASFTSPIMSTFQSSKKTSWLKVAMLSAGAALLVGVGIHGIRRFQQTQQQDR